MCIRDRSKTSSNVALPTRNLKNIPNDLVVSTVALIKFPIRFIVPTKTFPSTVMPLLTKLILIESILNAPAPEVDSPVTFTRFSLIVIHRSFKTGKRTSTMGIIIPFNSSNPPATVPTILATISIP